MQGHAIGAINPFTIGGVMALIMALILFPARPAPRPAPIVAQRAHRLLWHGLGLLWGVDGLLQWQPALYFSRKTIDDLAQPVPAG